MGDGRKWAAEEAEIERAMERIAAREKEKEILREAVSRTAKELVVTPSILNKEGRKFDQGKTRWSLLAGLKAARMVAEVLTYGAKKYAPNNFKHVKGWRWRYVDAAFRHINAHLEGEAFDPETGYHHLAHAICCLVMLLDNELNNMPNGDDEC